MSGKCRINKVTWSSLPFADNVILNLCIKTFKRPKNKAKLSKCLWRQITINKQERKKTKQNTKRDVNLLKRKRNKLVYNKQKGKVTSKYSHMFGVVTEKIFSILQRPKLSKRVCLFAAAHSALFSYCCRETKRCCGDYDVK